jgi:hypothetical protein
MFKAFSTNLTERIDNEEHPIIVQHLLKYEKLFPALALIMHLVECGSGKTVGRVGVTSAEKAMAWCEYLESHARRCYGLLVDGGLRSAIALAQKIEAGKLPYGFIFKENTTWPRTCEHYELKRGSLNLRLQRVPGATSATLARSKMTHRI